MLRPNFNSNHLPQVIDPCICTGRVCYGHSVHTFDVMLDAVLRRPALPKKREAGADCRKAMRTADRSIAMTPIVSLAPIGDWRRNRRGLEEDTAATPSGDLRSQWPPPLNLSSTCGVDALRRFGCR